MMHWAERGAGSAGSAGGKGRGRGGSRQRARERAGAAIQSALVQFLLEKWAWGWISGQFVQAIAAKVKEDLERIQAGENVDVASLELLANLGTGGQYSNNMSKELINRIPSKICQPMHHDSSNIDVLLPHELFSTIYNSYPNAFMRKICPNADVLEHFWNEMESNPQFINHPVKKIPNYKRRAIPVSIHGDGVPVVCVGKAWRTNTHKL